jgi:hypothetical protein
MNKAMSELSIQGGVSPVFQGSAATTSSATAHSDFPRSQPLCIPDHELLSVMGSGAYGDVWLARSVVGTLRAVKIVRRDRHACAESPGNKSLNPRQISHARLGHRL